MIHNKPSISNKIRGMMLQMMVAHAPKGSDFLKQVSMTMMPL